MDVAQLKQAVAQKFPLFGPNKVQEIARLVFEISRRDGASVAGILAMAPESGRLFAPVKEHFLRIRYPQAHARGIPVRESFAAIDIDPAAACDVTGQRRIHPSRIGIEREVEHSVLARRLRTLFPDSVFEVIGRYKDVQPLSQGPADFNRRLDQFYIVKAQYGLLKPCPCTPGVVSCGYHNIDLGFGCPFDCSYCFLQNYTNAPGIVFPGNIDDLLKAFAPYAGRRLRLGSGETTDSLAFDHITGFAPVIVNFFRSYPETLFEFKTKSDNVDQLLSVKGASNIVAAWSLNPQGQIDREEFYTASLSRRLEAARRCAAGGYRTAFHFDPIFDYPGWQEDYAGVVDALFRAVPAESIAWISLGTLRMTIRQKKMIENRFPLNTILSSELLTAPDGKVRYHQFAREEIYRFLLSRLRSRSPRTPVYLCMESAETWRAVGLSSDVVW